VGLAAAPASPSLPMGGRLSMTKLASASPAIQGTRTQADCAGGSDSLREEDADYLAVNSAFTGNEIAALWKLFHEVDADQSGKISERELLAMPQLAFNPLSERVVRTAFDKRRKRREELSKQQAALARGPGVDSMPAMQGGITNDLKSGTARSGAASTSMPDLTFEDFVYVLSPFAVGASADDKLRLAFAVYDFDGDGKLGDSDLQQLLRHLLPVDMEAQLIEQVVDMAMLEADKDGDGYLDLLEFKRAVNQEDFAAKLTMTFDR